APMAPIGVEVLLENRDTQFPAPLDLAASFFRRGARYCPAPAEQGRTCREDPGTRHDSGLHQFAPGNREGGAGEFEHRSDAEREVNETFIADADRRLRHAVDVGVGIDQTGQDGKSPGIDLFSVGRDAYLSSRTDDLDTTAAHDEYCIIDHLTTAHRDDARSQKSDHPLPPRRRQRQLRVCQSVHPFVGSPRAEYWA